MLNSNKLAGRLRPLGIAIGVVLIMFALYRMLVLPRMRTWGATAEEVREPAR